MNDLTLEQLQTRSLRDMQRQVETVKAHEKHYSLAEFIRHRINLPMNTASIKEERSAAVESAYMVSDQMRQSCGQAPTSLWVPLLGMTSKRDLSSASDTGLGAVASGRIKPGSTLQSALTSKSAVLGGATIVSGLQGGDFDLLGVATPAAGTSTFAGEVGTAPVMESTFKKITLTPRSITATLLISRFVLTNKQIDMEQVIREHLLQRFMLEIDRQALIGSGAPGHTGILNDAGLSLLSAGANGAAPTWDLLTALELDVLGRTGEMKNPAYITSPYLVRKLRRTQRAAGLDFIMPERNDVLMGNPLIATTNIPDNLVKGASGAVCSALAFGDLSEVIVGFFGPVGIDLTIDPYTQAAKQLVRITARADVGIAPRNISAFAAYKDLLGA